MLIARGRSQMKPLGCAESVRLGMRERILDFQKAIAVGRSWSWLDLSSSVLPSRNLDISLWEKTRHPGEKEENKMEWLENTHTHTLTHTWFVTPSKLFTHTPNENKIRDDRLRRVGCYRRWCYRGAKWNIKSEERLTYSDNTTSRIWMHVVLFVWRDA